MTGLLVRYNITLLFAHTPEQEDDPGLRLDQLLTVLLIVPFGVLLSLLCLAAEVVLRRELQTSSCADRLYYDTGTFF